MQKYSIYEEHLQRICMVILFLDFQEILKVWERILINFKKKFRWKAYFNPEYSKKQHPTNNVIQINVHKNILPISCK